MKGSGTADLAVVDEFDGGVGWLAYPDEAMQRASHALSVDGEVWVFDPVDADGVDDLIAGLDGEVAGVVVALDRHSRDAAEIASRHDVPVHIPNWMTGVASKMGARVERFGRKLGGMRAVAVRDSSLPPWQEVALFHEDAGTLYVPEAVGTAEFMRTGDERLGVHPMLRLIPPRQGLGGLTPERVLCGHGAGVLERGSEALALALDRSRDTAHKLYLKNLRTFLG